MAKQINESYILLVYDFHFKYLEEHADEIKANSELNIDIMAYMLSIIFKRYHGIGREEQVAKARNHNVINIYSKIIEQKYKNYLPSLKYLLDNNQIVKTKGYSKRDHFSNAYGLTTEQLSSAYNDCSDYVVNGRKMSDKLQRQVEFNQVENITHLNNFDRIEGLDCVIAMCTSFNKEIKLNDPNDELEKYIQFKGWLNNEPNPANYLKLKLAQIKTIQAGRVDFTVGKNGRVYDNGLKQIEKCYRVFFKSKRGNKPEYCDMDIANAYPTFTFILLKRIYNYLINGNEKNVLALNSYSDFVTFKGKEAGGQRILHCLLNDNTTHHTIQYLLRASKENELKKELDYLLQLCGSGLFYDYFTKDGCDNVDVLQPPFSNPYFPSSKHDTRTQSKNQFMLMLHNTKRDEDWESRTYWNKFQDHFPLATTFWKEVIKLYHQNNKQFYDDVAKTETQIRIKLFEKVASIKHKDHKYLIGDMHDGYITAQRNKEKLQLHFGMVTKKLFADLGISLQLKEKPMDEDKIKYDFYKRTNSEIQDVLSITDDKYFDAEPIKNSKKLFIELLAWDGYNKKPFRTEHRHIKTHLLSDEYMLSQLVKVQLTPNKTATQHKIKYFRKDYIKRPAYWIAYLSLYSKYDPLLFKEYLRSFLQQKLSGIQINSTLKYILPKNKTLVRTVVLENGNYKDVLFEKAHKEK